MNNFFIAVSGLFAGLAIYGWGSNIVSLVQSGLDSGLTVEALLRMIGIVVVPLGVVMGYI